MKSALFSKSFREKLNLFEMDFFDENMDETDAFATRPPPARSTIPGA